MYPNMQLGNGTLYLKTENGEYKELQTTSNKDLELSSSEKISEGISLFANGMGELFSQVAIQIAGVIKRISPVINASFNKKYTKKKFMKQLQSYGIQRNEINKIIANNKDPYTYKRLSEVLNLYKKDSD